LNVISLCVFVWTEALVWDRIVEARLTMRQYPSPRLGPRGFKPSLPQVVRTYFEGYNQDGDPGYDDGVVKIERGIERDSDLGPATPDAIDRAFEVEDWLQWVSRREREMLWRMADFEPMHKLKGRFRCSRWTLNRRKAGALRAIVGKLNRR